MLLLPEEKAALSLRELYSSFGYKSYRMSRFEEYDFYADKKDFLISKSVLTFTDINGRLMALRPDVTLSIIRHVKDTDLISKFFYDEKVYTVPKNAKSFREIPQTGIEYIGKLSVDGLSEVIELAMLSLKKIADGRKYILDVADAGMISKLLEDFRDSHKRSEILKCLSGKNIHGLKSLNAPEKLIRLAELGGNIDKDINELDGSLTVSVLKNLKNYHNEMRIDFSAVSNLNYYNGIVFRGFIQGIPESILSGGQYDNMMSMMGHKNAGAAGFAVYLGLMERIS